MKFGAISSLDHCVASPAEVPEWSKFEYFSKFHETSLNCSQNARTNSQLLIMTLCYKKKVLSSERLKQSLMRRFFLSRLEGSFWPFEISAFSYCVIIFMICDGFNENFRNSQFVYPIKESTWDFFQNFAFRTIPKNEAQNVKKRDFRISKLKNTRFNPPRGKGAAWNFFWVSRVIFDAIGEVPNSFIG